MRYFKLNVNFKKIIQIIENKKQELESQLRVAKDITSSISIFFSFIKQSQKLSNSSLFTDEIEFI